MIEAYVTNLGKYNEGELRGEYLTLPATKEEVQALLSRIGVDGVIYEEVFITDYETDIEGLSRGLGEYESIDELNYLASLLEEMDMHDLDRFTAALEYGEYTNSVKDLINLTQNLDCYEYYPDVSSNEDLGYYMIDELCMLDIPENIQPYFDYEAYGRDISLDAGGTFTDKGFIASSYDGFIEHYSGRDDLPEEHKVFAYPKPEKSIQKAITTYLQMINESPISPPDKSTPSKDDR